MVPTVYTISMDVRGGFHMDCRDDLICGMKSVARHEPPTYNHPDDAHEITPYITTSPKLNDYTHSQRETASIKSTTAVRVKAVRHPHDIDEISTLLLDGLFHASPYTPGQTPNQKPQKPGRVPGAYYKRRFPLKPLGKRPRVETPRSTQYPSRTL
jgi:hypothetical protein